MRRSAGVFLLAVSLLAGGISSAATAAGPVSSDDKLRQFMAQVRPQPAASLAGGQAVRDAAAVSPARLQERAELLKTGETALAGMQLDAALQAFERAALILHAADTEMALVRSYMQSGEYRRALAFGAHTAGAHLDVVGGSALYAWLLHAGGQTAIAQRLLTEAQGRSPGNAVVDAVQQQLRSGTPLASGNLRLPPTRLAPYGDSRGLAPGARVIGSGLLLHSGKQAVVPLVLVRRSGILWLRNGLGQLTQARVTQRLTTAGVALVNLDRSLPVPDDLWVATRDAFPGSVGFAIEYAAAPDAAPAWPLLRTGFLGGVSDSGATRLLGIDMPSGPRGGPVFDAGGRLIGLALPGKPGAPDRLLLNSGLPRELRAGLAPAAPTSTEPRASADRIYEIGLKASLQVIAVP